MLSEKAPDPKHCWSVVKSDGMAAVRFFYHSAKFERIFYASCMSVIPKKASALKDFRPISLLERYCKIISKLLIERLEGHEMLGTW